MQPYHRPQLIQDLSDTALGLLAEAETMDPHDARALLELAGTLDMLRVKLIADGGTVPRINPAPDWQTGNRH